MKKAKHRFFTFFIFLIIAVIAVVLFLYTYCDENGIDMPFLTSAKANKFENALNEYNYQAAATVFLSLQNNKAEVEILENHLKSYFEICYSDGYSDETWQKFKGIEVFSGYIEDAVLSEADSAVTRFYAGEFTKSEVKTYVSRICKFGFAKNKLTDCSYAINYKETSDEAYNTAAQLIVAGDYINAIKEMKKISTYDQAKYNAAKDGIESCKNIILPEKIAVAKEYIAQGNTSGAEDILDELLDIFPDEEIVKSLKSEIASAN